MNPSLWITRSQPGAQRLAEALNSSMLRLLVRPLVEIAPSDAWRDTAKHHSEVRPDLVCVTSQHAAEPYLDSELAQTAVSVEHVAVGPATADPLVARSLSVCIPAQHSAQGIAESESVVALSPKSLVWLVAGEQGREVLADALAKRGIKTVKFEFYRRVSLPAVWPEEQPVLVEVSSLTALRQFVSSRDQRGSEAPPPWPVLIAASARLAQAAQEQGAVNVVQADGAGVLAMKQAIMRAAEEFSEG